MYVIINSNITAICGSLPHSSCNTFHCAVSQCAVPLVSLTDEVPRVVVGLTADLYGVPLTFVPGVGWGLDVWTA